MFYFLIQIFSLMQTYSMMLHIKINSPKNVILIFKIWTLLQQLLNNFYTMHKKFFYQEIFEIILALYLLTLLGLAY